MTTPPVVQGLYVITSTDRPTAELLSDITAALQGGASVIQYRSKNPDEAVRKKQVAMLLKLCRRYQVPLIINDDIELVRLLGADGIHLGRSDCSIQQARSVLGADSIIGASCYNSLELACKAADAGADYVAFGSFYTSRTKPEATRATVVLLQQARNTLNIPIVAIGGITPQNGGLLVQAGANALAVISGLYTQDTIEQTARQYAQLFQNPENTVLV